MASGSGVTLSRRRLMAALRSSTASFQLRNMASARPRSAKRSASPAVSVSAERRLAVALAPLPASSQALPAWAKISPRMPEGVEAARASASSLAAASP